MKLSMEDLFVIHEACEFAETELHTQRGHLTGQAWDYDLDEIETKREAILAMRVRVQQELVRREKETPK